MNGYDVALLAAVGVPLIGVGAWWENEKRKKEIEKLSFTLLAVQEQLAIHERRIANIRKFNRKRQEDLT